MRKNFVLVVTIVMAMLTFVACKSKFEEVEEYISKLSAQLTSCTTQEQYDKVYEKVTGVDEMVATVSDNLSEKEKIIIIEKTAELILRSLVVKDILYVIPKGIEPTEKDMKEILEEVMPMVNNLKNNLDGIKENVQDVIPKKKIREIVKYHFGK